LKSVFDVTDDKMYYYDYLRTKIFSNTEYESLRTIVFQKFLDFMSHSLDLNFNSNYFYAQMICSSNDIHSKSSKKDVKRIVLSALLIIGWPFV